MPRKRNFLFVPYTEKEEAKRLGAIWDNKEKKFYAPFYLDQTIFQKWTRPFQKKDIDLSEALLQFKEALNAQGLMVDMPIMNGKLQRCATQTDKKGEKSGAYIGFLDGYPAGYIENFKTGYKDKWKFQLSKDNTPTKAQKPTLKQKDIFNEAKLEKEQELLILQRKTALRLEKEYLAAKEIESLHPYLIKKGLDETYHLKIDKYKNLLIPFRDENDKLWSLQRITKEGKKIIGVIKTNEEQHKNLEYAARKKGCFYTQTPLKEQSEFLICEGFATAMTIQKALNKPTIMAIDAGNLSSVVENLKRAYPDKQITIFADNDLKLELQGRTNTGLNAAKHIQEQYPQIRVVVPQITELEAKEGISDFNDIYVKKGLVEIQKQCKELFKDTSNQKICKNKQEMEL